ncbi:ATP-dependent Clp protease proteolytic subunit, partial [Tissierella praeacuta]
MNKKNKDDNSPIQEEKLENIKEIGTVNIPEVKNNIQFISIIGEIEGHTISPNDKKATKYEHIIPLLIAAQQDPKIEGIFIILNTVGGDVEAGLALSELINSVDKPKVSLVL